jgi:hypothetical protein
MSHPEMTGGTRPLPIFFLYNRHSATYASMWGGTWTIPAPSLDRGAWGEEKATQGD